METAIVPGAVFDAAFTIQHVDGEVEVILIRGKVVDWHFYIHDFSETETDVLQKTHLAYSVQILDSNSEEFYEFGSTYIVKGRALYPAIKYVIETPKDTEDLIRVLKSELKQAYMLEIEAAKANASEKKF